jgi:hypothetical protein
MREASAATDGDRALAVAVDQGVDLYVRAARLWPALHAAAVTDPDVETSTWPTLADAVPEHRWQKFK